MTHAAGGDGPAGARIMLIGEAWGQEEERTNLPFQGASGQELNRMLHEAGIMRSECYTTNVVNARPQNNDIDRWVTSKRKDITPDMVKLRDKYAAPIVRAGILRMMQEIVEVKPNMIVALGKTALWALTGYDGITKWRGSQLNLEVPQEWWPAGAGATPFRYKVIPTLHPALVLRDFSCRPTVINDLKRAARERDTARYNNVPLWHFDVPKTLEECLDVLGYLERGLDSGELEWIDFDIETAAGHIDCVGLSWSRVDAVIIPLMCREDKTG